MIVFNLILLKLAGNIGVVAYGIIANLSLIVTSIFTGISQGIQPIVSQAYGEQNLTAIRKYFRYSMVLSAVLAVGIYAIVTLGHVSLISAFNETGDVELFKIAKNGIYLYFTAFLFVGINIISSAMFGAANRPVQGFVLSILRGFLVILPCVIILLMCFGMTGVWLAFPVAEMLRTIVAVWILWIFFTGDMVN